MRAGTCRYVVPLLLAATLAAPACRDTHRGPSSAAGSRVEGLAGQTLRVYTFPNRFGPTTVSSFEERTGSHVVVETYASNEDLLLALDGGAGYDVLFPSSYAVERLIQQGRLRALDHDRVPNIIQVPERFRNPPVDPSLGHCIPYAWSLTGLGVRERREARGHTPESLGVLFSGAAGDKVLMLDDMRATIGVALRYLGFSASTRDEDELSRARELLLSQAPRVLGYTADAGPALASGQASVALAWSQDVLSARRKDTGVRFVVPREGSLLDVDYACVSQATSSPALAFAFLDHLLDPQVAAETMNARLLATPNDGAQRLLAPEARWLWGTLDALKDSGRFELIRDVGPAAPIYASMWREIKARIGATASSKDRP